MRWGSIERHLGEMHFLGIQLEIQLERDRASGMSDSGEPRTVGPSPTSVSTNSTIERRRVRDHRLHFRKGVNLAIEFTLGGTPRRSGVCKNLGLGGLQIETSEPAPFGSRVIVFIELEGIEGETELPGIVRWTRPNRIGVQLDLYGARVTYALLRMLAP